MTVRGADESAEADAGERADAGEGVSLAAKRESGATADDSVKRAVAKMRMDLAGDLVSTRVRYAQVMRRGKTYGPRPGAARKP
jgi:hypothetical protein